MNVLSLRMVHPDGFDEPAARILVDGLDLIDLVRAIEAPLAEAEGSPSIAGGYEGLPWSEVVHSSSVLLGGPNRYVGAADVVSLLTCSGCGEYGCWPLIADLQITAEIVKWSSFRQPHRPSWRYDLLGPFTFDAAAYRAVLSAPVA
jgi:hypothetical protein